ncbi:tripartite tricarboxylate transporter permease [Halostreptopolyspora alba]|uniref:Tripartite tricarboxylate transporter permease n=1 Tax=Halostreptopolyspora alba TaxID=2487137 RepID=A0A3N0EEN2_9ACTN|nr:tripartite tricarboxylate transporter permease [Nocardiopsaceae bacterium YIM 96095]
MLSPTTVLLLLVGVLSGMVVGVIPGLGPSAGLAILLPLTFGLEPVQAIVMLAAVYYGAFYGSTISSVLINAPGDAASVPTALEGYPMARRGRAAPALVLGALASFVAGTVAAVLLTVAAPAAASVTSSFGPPELFLLIVLGLLTMIMFVGKNWVRGLLSVMLGFAIGTVGVELGGSQRYTFGSTELINGIPFIPVAIGLFGLGEILWTLYNGAHRQERAPVDVRAKSAFWPNRSEWREGGGAIARGAPLGFGMGIIPGAGATVSSLMAYSMEKGISRKPERFGNTGAPAGLAGPEAANNAAATGAMVPLLTLGIPGSASTAVLLGGFLMWELKPGPLLMEQNPEFAWGLIGSMYLGNVVLLLVNIFCIPVFASVTRISLPTLAPLIMVLCAFGAFTVNGSIIEVGIMFGCAFLGFFMRLYGLSPATLVIALVLGPMAEDNLRRSLIASDGSFGIFVSREPSVVLLCVAAALLVLPLVAAPVKRAVGRRFANRRANDSENARSADTPEVEHS